jgi:hypothetical protein
MRISEGRDAALRRPRVSEDASSVVVRTAQRAVPTMADEG